MTLDRRVLILYAAAGGVCIKELKKKINAFVSVCVKRRQFPSFSVHRVH